MINKISIIVPIYNVEKYLSECLDSIVSQSYNNLEIILINDGSKDSSLDIAKKYAAEDKRILLYSRENHGVSASRNFAMSKMSGDYFCFIDSDDIIRQNYIETLVNAVKTSKCLIAECLIKSFANGANYENYSLTTTPPKIVSYFEYYKNFETRKFFSESLCNKIFHISLVDRLQFPEGKIYEDSIINCKLYEYVNTIACVDYFGYLYRKNNESITRAKFYPKQITILYILSERVEYLENINTDLACYHRFLLLRSTLTIFAHAKYCKADKKYLKEISQIAKETYKKVKRSNYINFKTKIMYLLFSLSKKVFAYVMHKRGTQ